MFHSDRAWSIEKVDREKLIEALANHSWCSCQGFECEVYLFLNDQTSPDGAGEWGVVKKDGLRQVESITFSWCDEGEVRRYVEESLSGANDDTEWGFKELHADQIDYSPKHRCYLCR